MRFIDEEDNNKAKDEHILKQAGFTKRDNGNLDITFTSLIILIFKMIKDIFKFIIESLRDDYLKLRISYLWYKTYIRKEKDIIYKFYHTRKWGDVFHLVFDDELDLYKLDLDYYVKNRLKVNIIGCATPKPKVGDFIVFHVIDPNLTRRKIRDLNITSIRKFRIFVIYKVDHMNSMRDFYKATIGYTQTKDYDWFIKKGLL